MGRIQIILAVTFCTSLCLAQTQTIPPYNSHISPQGGINSTDDISLEWTLGENFVETVSLEQTILTQGFQQTYLDSDVFSNSLLRSIVFPNPTNSELNVFFTGQSIGQINLSLYDIRGNLIKTTSFHSADNEYYLDLKNLSSGLYMLHISNSNHTLTEIHKVVKH